MFDDIEEYCKYCESSMDDYDGNGNLYCDCEAARLEKAEDLLRELIEYLNEGEPIVATVKEFLGEDWMLIE